LATLKAGAMWGNGRFRGEPTTAVLGDGTLTASLGLTLDGPLRVELRDLAVTALPLDALLVDFLCAGYAVTGPLDLTGSLSLGAPSVSSTLSGFVQLHIGAGKVVGKEALGFLSALVRVGGAVSALLSADLPWSLFSSPLDFDSITASVGIRNGVLTTHDLVYSSSVMRIAATGEYELATGRIDLNMVVNHGRGQAYARVTGTAESPSFHVTPSTILREVDPGKIGRGLKDLFDRWR
jgi:hypothetical protein